MYSVLNKRCDEHFEEEEQLKAETYRLERQNEALQTQFTELIGIRNNFARLEPVSITIRICPHLLTYNRSGKA